MLNRISQGLIAASLALCVGCNNSPKGGNPETHDSFKISAPAMSSSLKQGEKEVLNLSVSRGSDFKKAVTLQADAPKGLKVTLKTTKVTPSDPADVSFTVEAEKNAPLGDQTIKITGTPDSGAATSVDVKVKVTEAPKT